MVSDLQLLCDLYDQIAAVLLKPHIFIFKYVY